jgi:starch synthase (maltosyl-transferring)
MRNRLCALSSTSGGYAFTCGVEWLAAEKIDVHSSRGLSWGNPDNLLPEITALNRLLTEHPCFFDGAKLTRLSPVESGVYALRRDSAEGLDTVLVLVNTDVNAPQTLALKIADYDKLGRPKIDLLGQKPPVADAGKDEIVFELEPGAAYCLAVKSKPAGLAGDDYRRARAQSSWAIRAMSKVMLPEEIGPCAWRDLAGRIHAAPRDFLGALANVNHVQSKTDLLGALDAAKGKYPQVVTWTLLDRRRVTPVPPNHWLLLQDARPFRATLRRRDNGAREQVETIEVRDGHVACFPPRSIPKGADADLAIERYGLTNDGVTASIRFLAPGPNIAGTLAKPPIDSLVLLTNDRGGMARLRADLGSIQSKYDCALGANLHPDFPVDRHVFVKRIRAWITADGFTTPLNLQNLISLKIGPPTVWHFLAEAGDGRTVELQLTADMMEGSNTTVFRMVRLPSPRSGDLPPQFHIYVTIRPDIEDRNFHTETHRNDGADFHFTSNCQALTGQIGFAFTPAPDRQLRIVSSAGVYHPAVEWSHGIPHPIELSRGQVGEGDAFSPGWFELPLVKNQPVTLVITAEKTVPEFASVEQSFYQRDALEKVAWSESKFSDADSFGRRLAVAARAYVAKRGAGKTVIAGYPWFLDWGRDTFISARGLLAAGMVSDVADLLVTFGRFSENGTMPNTIHGDNASNRDTSDAPLWYGVVCEETAERMGPQLYETRVDATGRKVADVLREIALGYARGTPNGIRMDAASALIWSPPHFTWMDTNYPAGTPRQGYPVEIQVLWIRLLRQAQRLNLRPGNESWDALASRAEESLRKYFWLEEKGYVSDLLLAEPGQSAAQATVDQALRNNYLFAIAFGLFAGEPAQRAVDAALRYLVVPGALRTLAPLPASPPLPIYNGFGRLLNNPSEPYWGHYQGDEDTQRKPAYHNGTAWVWIFPTACEALAKAWNNSPGAVAAAKALLASTDQLMLSECLGQLPEIIDGDAPHTSRGCDAQAWSVTETLRVWKWLEEIKA